MIKNHFTVGIIEAGISLSEELELKSSNINSGHN